MLARTSLRASIRYLHHWKSNLICPPISPELEQPPNLSPSTNNRSGPLGDEVGASSTTSAPQEPAIQLAQNATPEKKIVSRSPVITPVKRHSPDFQSARKLLNGRDASSGIYGIAHPETTPRASALQRHDGKSKEQDPANPQTGNAGELLDLPDISGDADEDIGMFDESMYTQELAEAAPSSDPAPPSSSAASSVAPSPSPEEVRPSTLTEFQSTDADLRSTMTTSDFQQRATRSAPATNDGTDLPAPAQPGVNDEPGNFFVNAAQALYQNDVFSGLVMAANASSSSSSSSASVLPVPARASPRKRRRKPRRARYDLDSSQISERNGHDTPHDDGDQTIVRMQPEELRVPAMTEQAQDGQIATEERPSILRLISEPGTTGGTNSEEIDFVMTASPKSASKVLAVEIAVQTDPPQILAQSPSISEEDDGFEFVSFKAGSQDRPLPIVKAEVAWIEDFTMSDSDINPQPQRERSIAVQGDVIALETEQDIRRQRTASSGLEEDPSFILTPLAGRSPAAQPTIRKTGQPAIITNNAADPASDVDMVDDVSSIGSVSDIAEDADTVTKNDDHLGNIAGNLRQMARLFNSDLARRLEVHEQGGAGTSQHKGVNDTQRHEPHAQSANSGPIQADAPASFSEARRPTSPASSSSSSVQTSSAPPTASNSPSSSPAIVIVQTSPRRQAGTALLSLQKDDVPNVRRARKTGAAPALPLPPTKAQSESSNVGTTKGKGRADLEEERDRSSSNHSSLVRPDGNYARTIQSRENVPKKDVDDVQTKTGGRPAKRAKIRPFDAETQRLIEQTRMDIAKHLTSTGLDKRRAIDLWYCCSGDFGIAKTIAIHDLSKSEAAETEPNLNSLPDKVKRAYRQCWTLEDDDVVRQLVVTSSSSNTAPPPVTSIESMFRRQKNGDAIAIDKRIEEIESRRGAGAVTRRRQFLIEDPLAKRCVRKPRYPYSIET